MYDNSQPIFFPVSRFKLFVMSLVTFGLYQFFGFYKNWQLFKAATGTNISLFWRAFFNGLFCYSLITKIRNKAKLRGIDVNFSPFLLTVAWFGLALCARLPKPYFLVSFLSVIVLLPVQEIVNELNSLAAPNHNPNDRFSVWNILTIAVGGSLTVRAIIVSLMPA
jgi:hypothetical protein